MILVLFLQTENCLKLDDFGIDWKLIKLIAW